MTAEEKVKAKYPDAYLVATSRRGPEWYQVQTKGALLSEWKYTESWAWEDAAKRIGGGER